MLCTDLTGVKEFEDRLEAEPLWCNSWQCEHCAPRRRTKLIGQVIDGRPTVLLTLTVSPAVTGTQPERAQKLSHAWRELRRRIRLELALPPALQWLDTPERPITPALAQERRAAITQARRAPAPLPFYAVFEATQQGAPHLHIALRPKFIPHAWLSHQMQLLLQSPIVDIRQVHQTRGVARYVGKYLGKDAHKFGTCKRYWQSKDWNLDTTDHSLASQPGFLQFHIHKQSWKEYVADKTRTNLRYQIRDFKMIVWRTEAGRKEAKPCTLIGHSL